MEMLRHVFLEQPLPVYLICGVAELVSLAFRRNRRVGLLLLVWPAVAAAVGLLAWAVDTDREKVEHCWNRIQAGLDARRADRIMENVAEGFHGDGLDKPALGALADLALPTLKKDEVQVVEFRIEEVARRSARTRLGVIYNGLGHPFYTQWEVLFGPQADGKWRVTAARCTEPGGVTLRGAEDRLRRVKRMTGRPVGVP